MIDPEAAAGAQLDLLDHLWAYKDRLRQAGRKPSSEDYERYFEELRAQLKNTRKPVEA